MMKITEEYSLSADIWTEFEKFINGKGITSKYAKFYMIWAKKYIRYNNNEIPVDITKADIESFEDFLTADNKVESWQVEQAVKAATLLRHFIGSSVLQRSADNRSSKKEISFKDALPSKNPDRSEETKAIIGRVRNEIRYLHYSVRTEQNYTHWINRFMAFHKGMPINKFGAGEIKKYLEYLAVKRGVSASTQNQALLSAISYQL
jgi:hypothetical protein